MKTLTIRLPDNLADEIERESETRRISKSDVVRERLRKMLPSPSSNTLKEILEKSWGARVPADPPRFRSPKKQKLAEIIRAKKLRH